MKYSILTLLFLFSISQINAQLFTKVADGPIVNTISDSRSVNIVDLNGDGWDDVFISNGLGGGQDDLLYLNNGDGTFTESDSDITNDDKSSVGATFADFDNDGDLDAYVTNWYGQTNGLFSNDGNGTLTLLGVANIPQSGTYCETASWGDFDNDGNLDLFATNSDGNKKNLLFHNDGTGVFNSIDTGQVVNEADLSRNVDWLDIDNDGDQDLLVSNEANQANDLYLNGGLGYFEKQTGTALVTASKSSMSFSAGDIDNDGDLDLFFANAGYFQEQDNQLYRNENGVFEEDDVSILGMDGGCSYSSTFGDYDNDGDLDLFVSNGFCNSNLENYLYENDGTGNFQKVTDALPDLSAVCSYGAAWGDLNNDGFLDLVMANCKNSSSTAQQNNDVYINNGNQNNWIQINLIGSVSNRSAIGAKISLTAIIDGEEVTQLRTISAQTGYSSQNSLRAHFGLGDAAVISEINVQWPSGIETTQSEIDANQTITIEEQTTALYHPSGSDKKFNIIPNPTRGNFTIHFESIENLSESLDIKVIDTLGRIILQESCSSQHKSTCQMNISHLPVGAYQVGIYSKDRLLGKKTVIKL